jgi:aminoglycoside 6'-N-acetyltransferase I
MTVVVREMRAADRAAWAEMRAVLWPGEGSEAHLAEIDEIFKSREAWGFIAEMPADGAIAGFAEIAIRNYANGCDTRPVAFLEGIWVRPALRRRGIGGRLIRYAEAFLIARGWRELGSDTLFDNDASQAAHRDWGFSETERVIYFRKILAPPRG